MKILIITILTCILVSSCCCPCSPEIGPFERNQICENLKQDILLTNARGAPDDQGKLPTELAFLYKQYAKYNCPETLDDDSNY